MSKTEKVKSRSQKSDLTEKETPIIGLTDKAGYQRRNYEGLERLNQEIHNLTRPILGKRGFVGIEILEYWTDIVGENLALGIRPEKLTFEKQSRTNGTLHVKSAGGAYALLFEHQKTQVIDRINSFFGYPAVSFIKIVQGKLNLNTTELSDEIYTPTQEEIKALKEKTALIEDETLQKAFYQTGLAFLKKRHR